MPRLLITKRQSSSSSSSSPRHREASCGGLVTCGKRFLFNARQGIFLLFVVSFGVTYHSLRKMTGLMQQQEEEDEDHDGYNKLSLLQAYSNQIIQESSVAAMNATSSSSASLSYLPNLDTLFDNFMMTVDVVNDEKNKTNQQGIRLTNQQQLVTVTGDDNNTKTTTITTTNTSTIIPQWMLDYFDWHQQERRQLNSTNWNNSGRKYLIMTCFHGTRCGGVTDRLRPIIAMIRAASQSHRLLLIYWERPFPLEEFLLPPLVRQQRRLDDDNVGVVGLDWRVPSYMISTIKQITPNQRMKQYSNPNNPNQIVNTLFQSWDYGWLWYNEHLQPKEPPAVEIFRNVWNMVFEMTLPIQKLFDETFASLDLVPGEFATAHIRALYDLESRPHSQTVSLVRNAMNCASQLRPGGPFLVASDLLDALHEAQKYGQEKNVTVHTPSWDKEPLHIGLHTEQDPTVTPSDYYTVFVDIYLLAQSRCVAVGPGGFGYWAQVMGYDHNCWIRHSGERSKKCKWHDKEEPTPTLPLPSPSSSTTMAAEKTAVEPPRESSPVSSSSSGGGEGKRHSAILQQTTKLRKQMKDIQQKGKEVLLEKIVRDEERERRIHPVHTNFTYINQYDLWENTTRVPGWIQEYVEWHRKERSQLTERNFRKQRYIIMTCKRGFKCGGMTDRLRPILTHLQVAHLTSRMFFIYWERPFPLEEFLLPPEGGLNWRMPKFLLGELHKTQTTGNLDLKYYNRPEPMIVSTMHQSWHYGELLYNENKPADEPEAMKVFRDVWMAVFTPSPPVAQMIADSFHVLGIRPGHYATAHIRALYGIKKRKTEETRSIVNNAMNCLSRLRPGGPYLVASDSSEAVQLAKEYGNARNVTIVTPPHGKHPLHLGLHNESDTSIVPADFYDIFNDMYLIAETRCMVVGKGGFGRWGILLGHDPGCNTFSHGFKAETCDWHDPPPGFEVDHTVPIESQARMTIFRKPMDTVE